MIRLRFKLDFFNTKAVERAMDRATIKALSKAGAFIRRRAKSSIRKRKTISQPGNPPRSHSGELRRRIYFSANIAAETVAIGPVNWGAREAHLVEFGGSVWRQPPVPHNVSAGELPPDFHARPYVKYTYRARPFMGPALEAEAPNIPELWRNSIVL